MVVSDIGLWSWCGLWWLEMVRNQRSMANSDWFILLKMIWWSIAEKLIFSKGYQEAWWLTDPLNCWACGPRRSFCRFKIPAHQSYPKISGCQDFRMSRVAALTVKQPGGCRCPLVHRFRLGTILSFANLAEKSTRDKRWSTNVGQPWFGTRSF